MIKKQIQYGQGREAKEIPTHRQCRRGGQKHLVGKKGQRRRSRPLAEPGLSQQKAWGGGGGHREKRGLHWPLSDITTIGISQTMAAAADMSVHIW